MVVLAKPCLTWLYRSMQFSVIILAAGQGKRLKSAIPKPLHQLAGRPLISWVINAASDAGAGASFIVTGADNAAFIPHVPEDAELITQHPPQGTGHAVACCLEGLSALDPAHPVVILYADTPSSSQKPLQSSQVKPPAVLIFAVLLFTLATQLDMGAW